MNYYTNQAFPDTQGYALGQPRDLASADGCGRRLEAEQDSA